MNSKRSFLLLPALFIVLAAPSRPQNIPDAQQWLTTVDRSALFARQAEPLRFTDAKDELPAIVVNDMQQYQTMEGFGFALTGGSAELLMKMTPSRRSELLKRLFTTEGDAIGVSYLRVSIGSSDMNDHAYTYDDLPPGQTDPRLEKFSLAADESTVIPILKEILALDPEIKILGSPWSAPAWMKTNDALKGGSLKHEFYGAYANYLVKYIESMKAEGIAIHAITVENEPLNPKNTPR
jgi:glucosylceramidase